LCKPVDKLDFVWDDGLREKRSEGKDTMQEAYKAIADPTRRRLLKYLRGGERTAGELAEHVGIGRTALSHHLTVLKLADLVRVERRGQFQVYSLNTTVFQDLLTEILGWLGGIDEVDEMAETESKARDNLTGE
jgi:DNA-binding transcriptional ArsR family regulator